MGQDDHQAAVQGTVVLLRQTAQLCIDFLQQKHHSKGFQTTHWPQITTWALPYWPLPAVLLRRIQLISLLLSVQKWDNTDPTHVPQSRVFLQFFCHFTSFALSKEISFLAASFTVQQCT